MSDDLAAKKGPRERPQCEPHWQLLAKVKPVSDKVKPVSDKASKACACAPPACYFEALEVDLKMGGILQKLRVTKNPTHN